MTAPTPPSAPLPRNRRTEAIHKRETFWQIYVPVGIGLVITVGVGVLAALSAWRGGGAMGRVWADVSAVFVVLQAMAIVLPLLLVFAGVAVGLELLLRRSPPYFKIAQDYAARISREAVRATRYVTEPVVQFRSVVAGFDRVMETIRHLFGHNPPARGGRK